MDSMLSVLYGTMLGLQNMVPTFKKHKVKYRSYNPVGEYIIANCEKLVKENAGLNRG